MISGSLRPTIAPRIFVQLKVEMRMTVIGMRACFIVSTALKRERETTDDQLQLQQRSGKRHSNPSFFRRALMTPDARELLEKVRVLHNDVPSLWA